MTIQLAIPFIETEADLPPSLRLLLIEAAYRGDRRGVIRHSQTELATICGISRRTVAVYMNACIEPGILTLERRGRYAFNLETFKDMDVTLDERLGWLAGDARQMLNPAPIVDPDGQRRTRAEADQELARLIEQRQADQGIFYTKNGWPVLDTIRQGGAP